MFKYLKNDNGVALIFVIIMLVVVGGLSAALLVSSRGHVSTAVHEEAMAQAFHSAEAGVEFVRANIGDTIDLINKHDNNEIIINSNEKNIGDINNVEFKIELLDKDSNKLISIGRDNDYREEIEFNLSSKNDLKNFNIRKNNNKDFEDHYNIDGSSDGIEDYISTINWTDNGFERFVLDFISDNLIKNNKIDRDKFKSINTITNSIDQELVYSSDDLTIEKNVVISDSIVIVEGNIKHQNIGNKISINNSVIFVEGYVDIKGASSKNPWNNPMFFIYGKEEIENKNNSYLNLSGTGNFNVNIPELPDDFNLELGINNWTQK